MKLKEKENSGVWLVTQVFQLVAPATRAVPGKRVGGSSDGGLPSQSLIRALSAKTVLAHRTVRTISPDLAQSPKVEYFWPFAYILLQSPGDMEEERKREIRLALVRFTDFSLRLTTFLIPVPLQAGFPHRVFLVGMLLSK